MRNTQKIAPEYMFSLILVCLCILPLTTGCQSSATEKGDVSQHQMTDRLSRIAKESGGNWDKVSAVDKEYLVKEISNGDEKSARMLLQAKSGRPMTRERPSGPPRVGSQ